MPGQPAAGWCTRALSRGRGLQSQFVNALLAETARVWASWGASEEDALRAALPLVRGTLASIESLGIAGGMPGPVSRGDVASVEKHVAALAELGPHTSDFYRTLCGTTIGLALHSGAIDRAQAERFERAIAASLTRRAARSARPRPVRRARPDLRLQCAPCRARACPCATAPTANCARCTAC